MDTGQGNFTDKDAREVAMWLRSNGIPDLTCEQFEGIKNCDNLLLVYNPLPMLLAAVCAENDIDGECFTELTEADIKSLESKLGTVKKICRLQASVSHGL